MRDTLIALRAEDQAGRDSIALALAHSDSGFIQRLLRADSARARWLQTSVAEHGWPRRSVVGDTASEAALLIVQHSPMIGFQQQILPTLETEARRGEVSAARVAMLADRIRVRQGQRQRYATQFEVKDNELVPDPIADVAIVDSLRASVGLPPMAEYIKLLKSIYGLPVQWPPVAPAPRDINR